MTYAVRGFRREPGTAQPTAEGVRYSRRVSTEITRNSYVVYTMDDRFRLTSSPSKPVQSLATIFSRRYARTRAYGQGRPHHYLTVLVPLRIFKETIRSISPIRGMIFARARTCWRELKDGIRTTDIQTRT